MRGAWRPVALGVLTIGLAGLWAVSAADSGKGKQEVKAHLTLYVGGDLLRGGGTVIVASIPIPEDALRQMTGQNPAEADPNNAKRATLGEHDILLGARVTGRANYVETYYPESGTFGFNLVVDPREKPSRQLETERILIGSSRWPDPKDPDKWIDADVSTIFVDGTTASQSESRVVRVIESRVDALKPPTVEYQGVRVKMPTKDQLIEASSGEIK